MDIRPSYGLKIVKFAVYARIGFAHNWLFLVKFQTKRGIRTQGTSSRRNRHV